MTDAGRSYTICACLVDVDNSQLAYTQAELSRSTAIYNYLINGVEIDKLIGANNFATYTEEN